MSRTGPRHPGAAILVYHSVAETDRDAYGIAVTPENFRAQMEIVSRRFSPQRLEDVSSRVRDGEPPLERSVVVTFDDGYANNLTAALPTLAEHEVPATLFVATGYIGSPHEFWWDELERLLCEAPAAGAPALELTLGSESLRCEMVDRNAATQRLAVWLRGRAPAETAEGLEQVRSWAGLTAPPVPRESHRTLTVSQLRELAASPWVDIGAHTRRHPQLGARPQSEQHEEVEGSRADLRDWLGGDPFSFAYPYGNPAGGDYTPQTVQIVRELGFASGVSSVVGQAGTSSPPLELPRYFATARTPAEFERWLSDRFKPLAIRAARKLASLTARRLGRG